MRRVDNPPNPWAAGHVEWLGEASAATLTVYEDDSRTILAQNDSPDLPFRWSLSLVARLRAAFPERADKVLSLLRAMRGGRSNDPRCGSRMRGEGARYRLIADLFAGSARRLGLGPPPPARTPSPFRRPHREQWLFGGDEPARPRGKA